jgi:S-adenosylmethionine synthase
MARYLAKNIVASGLCSKCEIQISYAIGVAQPISIFIEDFGTVKCDLSQLSETILKHFDLSPQGIINFLNLKRPIYQQTACYGHFGKENLPRERLDSIELFKSLQ